MDVVRAIEERHSVRGFTGEDVPTDIIMETLRLANLAPSAGNLQARDFIIVKDKEMKKKLTKAAFGQRFVEEAPVVVVVCCNKNRIKNYGERGESLYTIQDSAASVQNMMLFLVSKGYGTCWVGAFDEKEVGRLMGLPDCARAVAMIPIGRPKESGRTSPRLEMDTIVHTEKW
ncbi:MAG: nitroreductase family protein [Methanomassiliicoccales archaeon]|jgi:nitroreductase